MAMSRKWWEPEAQDEPHDNRGRTLHSMDLGDLMCLAMNGGEFTSSYFAALHGCEEYDRQPRTDLFRWVAASGASVWSGIRRVHG